MADYIYGNYYLNQVQMEYNVQWLNAWRKENWSALTDISFYGLLGNFQQESTINPGLWQNKTIGTGGFGVAQWTPASKLFNWTRPRGYADWDFVGQMRWIRDHTVPYEQWVPHEYPYNVSWNDWVTYTGANLTWATLCFSHNWEMAGNAQNQNRINYAYHWGAWLGEDLPPVDPGPWEPPGPDDPAYGGNWERMKLMFYLRRVI